MGFELSNGWLVKFKIQNGLAKQRFARNARLTDPALIDPARESLQHALINKLLQDIYNCDETAFQ